MKPSDIRAAVFDGPGKPFRFETFPRPTLGPEEVFVRVSLNTVRLSATPRPLIPCVRQNMGSQGGGKHATARTLYRQ